MKSLETQQQDQLFGEMWPPVAAIAAEGLRKWRSRAIDAADLERCGIAQEPLAKLGRNLDDKTRLDVIEAAIVEAIEQLREPFRAAAIIYFDAPDDERPKLPEPKGPRGARAAECLHRTSARWFENPSSDYYGISPCDYVVSLVVCQLCGIIDDERFLKRRHGPAGATALVAQPPKGPRRRTVVGLAMIGVAMIGVALIVAIPESGHRDGSRQLATSTVIAGVASTKPLEPPMSGAASESSVGINLVACLKRRQGCLSELSSHPPVAQPGDVVQFRLQFRESYRQPISTMTLRASTATQGYSADVSATAVWKPPLPTSAVESRTSSAHVALLGPTSSGSPYLEYIQGSAELNAPVVGGNKGEEASIRQLPDSLFSDRGITLLRVGPRRRCSGHCKAVDVLTVVFWMRVVTRGLGT